MTSEHLRDENELYQIINPGNYEGLKKYESVDIFSKDENGDRVLIKPAGHDTGHKQLFNSYDNTLINLYIRLEDRIALIRNTQNQLNIELRNSLNINVPKAKAILTNLVNVTLSEPRTELLTNIKETIDVMLKEYLSNPEVVTHLVQVSIHDYSTSLHLTNCMLFCFGYAHYEKYDIKDMKELGLSALLHDIGKINIPDYLLQASRKLTDEEFTLIKNHTTFGYDILKNSGFSKEVKLATIEHHERIDGSGYPHGRKDLANSSKVIGIIDMFEAITNWRPYKKEVEPLKALKMIKKSDVDRGRVDGKMFKSFANSLVGMKVRNKIDI